MTGSKKKRILVMIVGAVSAVGGYFIMRHLDQRMYPPPSEVPAAWKVAKEDGQRILREIKRTMKPLLGDPRLKEYAEHDPQLKATLAGIAKNDSAASGRAVGHALVSRGIPRLEPADLDTWNRLRLTLAKKSPKLCAGYWTGAVKEPDMIGALAALSEEELREWLALSTRAGVLEIGAGAPPGIDPGALDEAFGVIANALTPAQNKLMERVFTQNQAAKPADACQAMLLIHREAAKLEPDLRHRFLRAMAHNQ